MMEEIEHHVEVRMAKPIDMGSQAIIGNGLLAAYHILDACKQRESRGETLTPDEIEEARALMKYFADFTVEYLKDESSPHKMITLGLNLVSANLDYLGVPKTRDGKKLNLTERGAIYQQWKKERGEWNATA